MLHHGEVFKSNLANATPSNDVVWMSSRYYVRSQLKYCWNSDGISSIINYTKQPPAHEKLERNPCTTSHSYDLVVFSHDAHWKRNHLFVAFMSQSTFGDYTTLLNQISNFYNNNLYYKCSKVSINCYEMSVKKI